MCFNADHYRGIRRACILSSVVMLICAFTMLLGATAVRADAEIGLRFGYGKFDNKHKTYIADRLRIAGNIYGEFDVFRRGSLGGRLLVDWEGYRRWFDLKEFNHVTYGVILDIVPALSFAFDRNEGMVISLGLGPTLLSERFHLEVDNQFGPDYDITVRELLGGVVAHGDVCLQESGIAVVLTGKYRLLSGEESHKYDPSLFGFDHDFVAKRQMWTLRGQLGFEIQSLRIFGGLQAENQVRWSNFRDGWPRWPKDWEYLIFGGLSVVIR